MLYANHRIASINSAGSPAEAAELAAEYAYQHCYGVGPYPMWSGLERYISSGARFDVSLAKRLIEAKILHPYDNPMDWANSIREANPPGLVDRILSEEYPLFYDTPGEPPTPKMMYILTRAIAHGKLVKPTGGTPR